MGRAQLSSPRGGKLRYVVPFHFSVMNLPRSLLCFPYQLAGLGQGRRIHLPNIQLVVLNKWGRLGVSLMHPGHPREVDDGANQVVRIRLYL